MKFNAMIVIEVYVENNAFQPSILDAYVDSEPIKACFVVADGCTTRSQFPRWLNTDLDIHLDLPVSFVLLRACC